MIVANPILPGFHPDPCAVRVDGDYYIASSTFEWYPGVEIHHSTDLLHWTLVARPLDTPALLDLRGVPNSGGVWAPCLSYANGLFYLLYSITRTVEETTQDTENYVTSAPDVRGPWAAPVRLHSGGFDASLFHDPDGSHWVVGMRWDSRVEQNHFAGIFLQEYCPTQRRLLGQPKLIYRGSSLGLTEGPHLYARHGEYLLMVAEGGTRDDHAVLVCKSTNREGPYVPDPKGHMLTARHRPDWPIQYAGHGSLVEDTANRWLLFHLGTRKKPFGGFSVLGRETFLQTVEFNSLGYPRLTGGETLPQETVPLPGPQAEPTDWAFTCDFSVPALPLRMYLVGKGIAGYANPVVDNTRFYLEIISFPYCQATDDCAACTAGYDTVVLKRSVIVGVIIHKVRCCAGRLGPCAAACAWICANCARNPAAFLAAGKAPAPSA